MSTGHTEMWQSIETAPRDGTEIVGRYGDNEVEIRWARERQCMLAGIGGGNGYFGPGWEDTYNSLIADPPDAWRHKSDELVSENTGKQA